MKKSMVILVIILCVVFTFAAKINSYFNNPPESGGIDVELIKLIDSAEYYIYAHLYQMGNMDIVNALVRGSERLGSSKVKLITEDHYFQTDKYKEVFEPIKNAGIKIMTDKMGDGIDRGQCHNKFVIIDDRYVWMGSYNVTVKGTYSNNNNALKFDSPIMAKIYKKEFEQMFDEGKFSIKKEAYDHPEIIVDDTKVKNYFSPKQDVKSVIINEIQNAHHSIYFCIFTFTDEDIMNAIIDKRNRGVKVYGVFDAFQGNSSYSSYKPMKEAGLNVKKDTNKGFLHHKFMVIDPNTNSDPTVITGSYNWTSAAGKVNDESTVVLKNNNEIAMKYYYEVAKCYGDGFDSENGSVVEIPQIDIKEPTFYISEVVFNDPSGDWVEIYCADDANNGNGIDIGGYYIEDDGLVKMFGDDTIVKTGDFIVVAQGWYKDFKKADNKKLYVFAEKTAFVSTDEQIIFKAKGSGKILDAVCWSNHDGSFSPGEEEDVRVVYNLKEWNSPNERECVDSTAVPSGNFSIMRRYNKTGFGSSEKIEFIDTNSLNDWVVNDSPTPGEVK
ncbi:MAG: phospholipase D-like domain-containing protein [Candidatus Muirbacterium halophilum]|nr:phospholipase D-like domain-containing protein [Candidatus Muirbacterium halophilum]